MTVVHSHITQLNELGYVALPGFMESAFLARLRAEVDTLFEKEGDQAGSEYKQEPGSQRLANLVDKAEIFREMILNGAFAPGERITVDWLLGIDSWSRRAKRGRPRCGRPQ